MVKVTWSLGIAGSSLDNWVQVLGFYTGQSPIFKGQFTLLGLIYSIKWFAEWTGLSF